MLVGQPILAGVFLDGEFDALALHELNAGIVTSLRMVLIPVTLLYWLPGGGRGWPVLAALALFFAEGIQSGFGYARLLSMHVPLGVAIVTGSVLFAVWVFGLGHVGRAVATGRCGVVARTVAPGFLKTRKALAGARCSGPGQGLGLLGVGHGQEVVFHRSATSSAAWVSHWA